MWKHNDMRNYTRSKTHSQHITSSYRYILNAIVPSQTLTNTYIPIVCVSCAFFCVLFYFFLARYYFRNIVDTQVNLSELFFHGIYALYTVLYHSYTQYSAHTLYERLPLYTRTHKYTRRAHAHAHTHQKPFI